MSEEDSAPSLVLTVLSGSESGQREALSLSHYTFDVRLAQDKWAEHGEGKKKLPEFTQGA